jgi:hypothetical protein
VPTDPCPCFLYDHDPQAPVDQICARGHEQDRHDDGCALDHGDTPRPVRVDPEAQAAHDAHSSMPIAMSYPG